MIKRNQIALKFGYGDKIEIITFFTNVFASHST